MRAAVRHEMTTGGLRILIFLMYLVEDILVHSYTVTISHMNFYPLHQPDVAKR